MIVIDKSVCRSALGGQACRKVIISEINAINGTEVEYDAEYNYCSRNDTLYADKYQAAANRAAMIRRYLGL